MEVRKLVAAKTSGIKYLSPDQVSLTDTREPCIGLIWTKNTTALVYSAARIAMCECDNFIVMLHVKYNLLTNYLIISTTIISYSEYLLSREGVTQGILCCML